MTPNLQGLTVSLPTAVRKPLYTEAMPFLAERDQVAVRKEFERIQGPVKLVVFSQELVAGELCRQNEQLVREVAALDDRISVEVLNPVIDRERAAGYGVEQVPAIVVEGARDYGIRFLGIPGGYEFSNLIDSIIAASSGEAALSDATKASLAELTDDVHIKVFSTPT
jgi:alkyl hydroperoxide reductase subunit AhpF